jgi:signal transduction histidine kinase
VIRGNADLLAADAEASPERREAIVQIRREADRLSRLVSDLLALARSETAETFAGRPVQLDEIVVEAFMEMRQLAGPRLAIGELDAVSVQGERDRLLQLVLALVDNALRYTPEPGRVAISLFSKEGDAVIQVDDDGIGIAAADLPFVFDRFYRGEKARRKDRSGSGLGLAIAKWIVERHAGTIALEPRFPRGTRVTVRLATDGKVASREATPAA